ncbi:hypothetical protein PIB30_021802 [Stylosanthes scabra]|uniref:Uncharacterized protein n=1 Tax=Stylosanthes scabra TaxID=79078 RepID=A0ABU6W8H2_9FABA|nr:hypothetical protein [Stylosanthes scabra]
MDKCVGTTVHISFVFHSLNTKQCIQMDSEAACILSHHHHMAWQEMKNNVSDGVHCCPELKIFQPCIILNFEKDGLLYCVYFLSPLYVSFIYQEKKNSSN